MTSPAQPAPDSPSTWRDEDLAANPHQHSDKASKVRSMFAAIAGSYDLNNRVHSLWQDVRWRNFAVKQADVQPGDHVLDAACGTGDLTQAFARTRAAKVTGLDFTAAMLTHAGVKQRALPSDVAMKITYIEGDAMQLPFPDASFDVVSIAFGIRNVTQPTSALREFTRVLKPAGRLVILEFERPKNPIIRFFNDAYCGKVMPITATLLSRDRSGAYRYLPRSVSTFFTREQMTQQLRSVGLTDVASWPLSFGICVCYRAVKP
jgi:demethylmenaquinone methyltransferase / 2-methoxy-6-polyprenyl-1,4-benzoquinol methylase